MSTSTGTHLTRLHPAMPLREAARYGLRIQEPQP
jgi:hypothetical protein